MGTGLSQPGTGSVRGENLSRLPGRGGGGINNLSMVKGTQGLRGGQTSQEVEVPILVPPQISG